jgi:P4 family phage/plasmid primase-like protien
MNYSTAPSGFQQPPTPRVERILQAFGPGTVLIPTRPGTKEPFQTGYPGFGIDKMSDPEHLAILEKSNIAILTGAASGNLISIDFDDDAAFKEFCDLNPKICETRRTVGARGCNLWFRIIGTYPDGVKKLSGSEDVTVGEWRAGSCITVVDGRHPSGIDYRLDLRFPVREVEFADITWPEGWKNVPGKADQSNLSDELVKRCGPPFFVGSAGGIQINESFIVEWIRAERHIVCAREDGKMYVYDEKVGIWSQYSNREIDRHILSYISRLAIESRTERLHLHNRSGVVRSIRQQLEAVTTESFFEPLVLDGWVAFPANSNTVALILPTQEEQARIFALPYSSTFRFVWKSPLDFIPGATCPRFHNEFLAPVLHPDDIRLLRMMCGLMLIGPNDSQKILLLEGAGDLGKGTLVRILQMIVGVAATEELRTRHLDSRFETARFLGKRILLGQDVQQDFLNTRNAALLKALTGGDTVGVERKGSNEAGHVKGNFHVIITSNAALTIRIESDASAWMRRLVVISFHRPVEGVPKRIPKLDEVLVREEGQGILSWLLDGACEALAEIQMHGSIRLTEAQRQRVEERVRLSDTVGEFVNFRLVSKVGARVPTHVLWSSYLSFCEVQGAAVMAESSFHSRIKQELRERFGGHVRASENVLHEGQRCRGYVGVELFPEVAEAVNTDNTDNTEEWNFWSRKAALTMGFHLQQAQLRKA